MNAVSKELKQKAVWKNHFTKKNNIILKNPSGDLSDHLSQYLEHQLFQKVTGFAFIFYLVRLTYEGMRFGTRFYLVSVQTDKILFICVLMWKMRQKNDDLKFCKTHIPARSVFCPSAVWPHITWKWLNSKG